MWNDLRPLLYAVLFLLPVARGAETGHTGGGSGHTAAPESGGTGFDDGCEDLADEVCIPWAREVQGECPARLPCRFGCQPNLVGPVYADGQCCWAVEGWYWSNCGCGC